MLGPPSHVMPRILVLQAGRKAEVRAKGALGGGAGGLGEERYGGDGGRLSGPDERDTLFVFLAEDLRFTSRLFFIWTCI